MRQSRYRGSQGRVGADPPPLSSFAPGRCGPESHLRGEARSQGITLARLGPVDDASDLVAVEEHVSDRASCRSPCVNTGVHGRSAASATWRLRVPVAQTRSSRALALAVEFRRQLVGLRPGHGGNGASCNFRMAAPAVAHAADDAVDGSPRRPSGVPGTAAIASTGDLRHRTSGVGTGARVIASTSTSMRA